jgi:thiol-disulfide isomerase/thioredoxin
MRKVSFILIALFAVALTADEAGIGSTAPAFKLVNAVDNREVAFKPGDGKLSVVVFTCNQCPYAKAFEPRLIEIAKRYNAKGVAFYAIDSNDDARYEVETLANMRERAISQAYPFPYLKDGDSSIARAYGARVTPHVFVVDSKGAIRYRGYIDDSARAEERTNPGLTNALDALIASQPVATASTKAFGCTIKWKG